MSKYKLLMKSIVFSTRSRRRFFTFVIVFSILSGATIILLSYFDNFSREGLLLHRGVVIDTEGLDTINLTQVQIDLGTNDGQAVTGAEVIIFFKYVNFGSNLRIFSLNSHYPWAFNALNPNHLVNGRFPIGKYEALVSEDALVALNDTEGAINIYTKPVIGTKLTIGASKDSDFELTVAGIFRKPVTPTISSDSREWILVTEEAFAELVGGQHLALNSDEIGVLSVTIIAGGDIFGGEAYSNVDALATTFQDEITGNPHLYKIVFVEKIAKDNTRDSAIISLLFGLFGTFMVSTLYAYLITRFRRREVAILKAMGYSKWDVRTVVLTEILVVAITGFLIGLIAIQAYFWNPLGRETSYFYLIAYSSATVLAFGAVVLSTVPGFILISARILSVRPIEIFRQK
ncbi:MAG: FtsX-like permease family protein [Candidatus Heimdallarchaeota archaeon]